MEDNIPSFELQQTGIEPQVDVPSPYDLKEQMKSHFKPHESICTNHTNSQKVSFDEFNQINTTERENDKEYFALEADDSEDYKNLENYVPKNLTFSIF